MNKQDELWRRLADGYLAQYGQELEEERARLAGQTALPTPGLDKSVWDYVSGRKRARALRMWGGLAAAGLVVALLTPALLRVGELPGTQKPAGSTAASSSAPPAASSEASSAAPAPPEILPLTFVLPEQFAVAAVELDQGRTVYTLDNRQLDPVVMTLELNGNTDFFDTLTPITLEGQRVYGSSQDGYQLLAFEKEGIVYQLTCRHDINTLADLSRSILV